MHFERIISPKDDLFVGISEISNRDGVGKDELISKATEQIEGILAIQLLDGNLIVDTHHLVSATQNAVNALAGDYLIARSLDIEIAVYASGQKQIGKALDTYGVKDGIERIAIVAVGETDEKVRECLQTLFDSIGSPFDDYFPPDHDRFSSIMHHFGIDEKEISTFLESDDITGFQQALSRCVASRISIVSFES